MMLTARTNSDQPQPAEPHDAARTGVLCAESIVAMQSLFQGDEGGSTPTSALQLRFVEIGRQRFKRLNREWHSRLPESPDGHRVCYAALFDGRVWAVAMWTNPSAPALPQREWIELKRFAIAPGRPDNTASRMLGWMARDIYRRFPEVTTLVSYRDCEAHDGTIYKAAGWIADEEQRRSPSTTWKNRPRERLLNEVVPRVVQRWTKRIRREVAQ